MENCFGPILAFSDQFELVSREIRSRPVTDLILISVGVGNKKQIENSFLCGLWPQKSVFWVCRITSVGRTGSVTPRLQSIVTVSYTSLNENRKCSHWPNGGPPCKSPFLYGETAPMAPGSMHESCIDWPAGPRGTTPAAPHPPNRYGPAPHTLPTRETGGARRRGR